MRLRHVRLPGGLLGLAATLGLMLAAPPRAPAGPDLVQVPDVTGQARADALAAVTAQGLLPAVFEVAGTPPDTVASESPVPGTSIPRGAMVILDVRRNQSDTTQAPSAVGLTPSAASAAFGSLYVLHFEPVAGGDADKGKVVSQAPAMGQALELRGVLTLRFVPDDALPARVSVPEVLGLSAPDAIQAMGAAGLHARVARANVPGAAPDTVVGQWPFPGTETDRYTTADVIATGPDAGAPPSGPAATATVPNCVGLSESSARAALSDATFAADVEWIDGPAPQAFLVDSQDPAAGTSAPGGSSVHLRIVRYAPPPPPPTPPPHPMAAMPYLIGMSQWQAEDLLVSLGLWANPILMPNPSVPPLRVFAQQVAPGTWIDVGSSVTFRVSTPPAPSLPVPVPDFYGKTKSTAAILAALAGLGIDFTDVVNPTKPPHRVYTQSVPAFTVVPLGTVIHTRVALSGGGPGTTTVPNLNGMTQAQAMAALGAAGLAGIPSFAWALGKPLLRVYAQSPAPGSSVPVGWAVNFTICSLFWPSGHTVPPLFGLTKAQAIAAVVAAGLAPNAQEAWGGANPVGKVFWQDPAAGTSLVGGSPVTFKVAKAITTTVPFVLGMTPADAHAALSAAGLGDTAAVIAALGKPPGRVWFQVPGAGASVAPGTVVLLRVQPGPAGVAVPNLIGMTKPQADFALSTAGFAANGTYVVAPPNPIGHVFTQSPLGGSSAPLGSTVAYKVAVLLPPAMVAVPNLFNMTQALAMLTLNGVGLNGLATVVVTTLHTPGRVFWQSPIAGVGASSGSVVNFRVAQAPPGPVNVQVPNLIGLTGSGANNALALAGLGSSGSTVFVFFKPPNRVYSQSPLGGSWVPPGTIVFWKRNP